ncbi:amino acid adenylation domain-containing protein [Streptomyces sp. NPDC018045]|uniref:amino acid adenylation domain-containing protein n=1 Tax=Streptomyces sp. NPDC018045 TaxID=3365037 RepID=UPI0037A07F38
MSPAPALGGEPFDWGLGDPEAPAEPGVCDLPLPPGTPTEAAGWFAAASAVLARYDTHGLRRVVPLSPADGARVTYEPVAGTDTLQELMRRHHPCESAGFGLLSPSGSDAYALTVTLADGPDDAPLLRITHDPRHVCADLARQWGRHVAHVHRQVLDAPDRTVDDAELLDAAEEARTVALGYAEPPRTTLTGTVTDAFDAMAERVPAAVALSDETVRLTYGELRAAADRFAHGLRALGVRRGTRVGVCLERSATLVVALLGVLRAGGTYVPMDPDHPDDRLAYTVDDADLAVVVTARADFPARRGTRRLTPEDVDARGAAGAVPVPVPGRVTAADTAYIIYTSGSTGRPKGVMVPHRNVCALVDATCDTYRLGTADTWTFFHSSAFDFSVWEIWGCLLTGGHLVVVPYWDSRDPRRFLALLAARRVTVLSQTPSAFAQLAEADRREPAGLAVRLVVFGGEPLDTRLLLPWYERHPAETCRTVNMFGITETTVHVTAQTLTPALARRGTRAVGRPLPGWYVRVTDGRGRTLPPGVAGEILVGGAGVADGYLNRADLTARRFHADPHGGGRVYRSGDLGRLRPDGTLEHLGRLDGQVKIRGFRVEPDEIRSVLREQPGVRAAAVAVRRTGGEGNRSQRLDAYVVLDGGHIDAVRAGAARLLPGHMMPATFTALPELPLTPNGKLDVAALPDPAARPAVDAEARDGGARDADTPRGTPLMERIRTVWQDTLGLPVGLDDDFYELGGDSLQAVRIVETIRDDGVPDISLRRLLSRPTVRELTESLEEAVSGPAG